MLNLQVIDNVLSTSGFYMPDDESIEDNENVLAIKEQIQNQYINLNELGVYLLDSIENDIAKINILEEMVIYVDQNYTSIVNQNFFKGDISEIGEFIYHFFCIDCYTMILPNFIHQINCTSIESFQKIFKNKYHNDTVLFKNAFLTTIKNIVIELIKLEKIDKKIKSNQDFVKLKKRFAYYLDLIEFGNGSNFYFNYILPLIESRFSEIFWRSE